LFIAPGFIEGARPLVAASAADAIPSGIDELACGNGAIVSAPRFVRDSEPFLRQRALR